MKAKISLPKSFQTGGGFHGFPIRLTIGLLVSNSIKTIRKCLDSIQPILEQVPSELIITHTGGTDGSIEIAKEYTNHLEKFTWCNDFAAARNVALKAAHGEWFLYLDDDEWFENPSELIHFFNSGECDEYNILSYVQRNYKDFNGKNYSDCRVLRCARLESTSCFEGIIHETLTPLTAPEKRLKCFVHHFGYANKEGQIGNPRKNRNVPLLEKLVNENPKDMHAWYQLTKEYVADEDWEKVAEIASKALKNSQNYNDCFTIGLAQMLAQAYIRVSQYQSCVEIAQHYLEKSDCNDLNKMMFYFTAQDASVALKNYNDAKIYGEKYFALFNKIADNPKLKEEQSWSTNTQVLLPDYLTQVELFNSIACVALQDYTAAQLWFDKTDLSSLVPAVRKREIDLLFQQIAKNKEKGFIFHCYQTVCKDDAIKEEIIEKMQALRKQDKDMHRYIADELADFDTDAPYCQLNRLYLAEIEKDADSVHSCMDWFIQHGTQCCGMYRDVLIYAMQFDINVTPLIEILDMEDWQLFLADVFADRSATVYHTLMQYYQNREIPQDNIKLFYLQNCMLENIVLYGVFSNDEDNKGYLSAFKQYTACVAKYAHYLYKDDMFTPENLKYLPRVYRFAYHMEQAQKAKAAGELQKYLQCLKDAMKSYPVMKKPLKFLIDKFENEQLAENHHAQEFFELAKQVKAQIEQLITARKLTEAQQLIEELSAMMPNDEDLGMYRLLIEQASINQPTITSQMPQ